MELAKENQEIESQTVSSLSDNNSVNDVRDKSSTNGVQIFTVEYKVSNADESAVGFCQNPEIEPQTVSSLPDNNNYVNYVGEVASTSRDHNMVVQYKVSNGDESHAEFCENPENDGNPEPQTASFLPDGNHSLNDVAENSSPGEGQNMVVEYNVSSRDESATEFCQSSEIKIEPQTLSSLPDNGQPVNDVGKNSPSSGQNMVVEDKVSNEDSNGVCQNPQTQPQTVSSIPDNSHSVSDDGENSSTSRVRNLEEYKISVEDAYRTDFCQNPEVEPRTVSSLPHNSLCVNDVGENLFPTSDQNLVVEYKASNQDDSPTQFCRNPEVGNQTVYSLPDNSYSLNDVQENLSPNRGQNMVVEFKASEDAEFPTVGSLPDNSHSVDYGGENSSTLGENIVEYKVSTIDESHIEFCQNPEICRNEETNEKSIDQHACHYLSCKNDDNFAISDLVWGKVKSHPWWPGQIVDPSDASDLALKYQKKDNFLVAYFGDKTFAWCDESQLKHFESFFLQMEKQSNSDVFISAVDDALDEFSRRFRLGLTCFCSLESADASSSHQKIENAGIREGNDGYMLNRSATLSSFQPSRLLEYVKGVAKFPDGGVSDRMELLIAITQLKAFYRLKGYPELPSFQFGSGLIESDSVIPHSKFEKTGEDAEQPDSSLSDLIPTKRKLPGRGSLFNKPKHVLEDGKKIKHLSELMDADGDIEYVPFSSNKKHKVTKSDSSDSGEGKKQKFDSLRDLEIKQPPPSISSSFKIGECIRRVAGQLTGSSSILKSHGETSLKNVSKDDDIFDVFISDGFSHDILMSPTFDIEIPEDYSPDEMLSQLCLAASDPMKEYNVVSTIMNFFTEFRNHCVSSPAIEKKHLEKIVSRRGRKRKVDIESTTSNMMETDHMKDSYWSDLIPHSISAKSKGEAQTHCLRKRRKSLRQTSNALTSVSILQGTERILVGTECPIVKQASLTERSIIRVEEKMVDECTPTALILNFNRSKSLPSEVDLIRIFSRYGPLKESATEVQHKNNRAKVVFKRRADAEIAFSSAGKYNIFGPSLLSYQLRYLSSMSSLSQDMDLLYKSDALPIESKELDSNLHITVFNSSNDTHVQKSGLLTDNRDTTIPSLHEPSMSKAPKDTAVQNKITNAVLTENSNTNLPNNLNMICDSSDTNFEVNSDAVLEESRSNDICNHKYPSMPGDQAETETGSAADTMQFTSKSDKTLADNRNTTITSLHQPSVCRTPEDLDVPDRSSVSSLQPSISDAPEDMYLHDKISNVVCAESSINNLHNNLHMSMSDLSPDTNLQVRRDAVLEENIDTKLSNHECLSIPEDQSDTIIVDSSNIDISETKIVNVVGKTEEILADRNNAVNPCFRQTSKSDSPEDMALQNKSSSRVLTESSNTNHPINYDMLTCDASTDTNRQNISNDESSPMSEHQSDSILIDCSNMDISVETGIENVVHTMQVASKSDEALKYTGNTTIPSLDQQSMSDAPEGTDLQAKSIDTVHINSSNTNLSDNLHLSTSGASADTNLQEERYEVLDGKRNITIPNQECPLMSEDHSDTILVDSGNMDISVLETEMDSDVDTRQVVSRSDEKLTDHGNTTNHSLHQPSTSDATKDTDLQDNSSDAINSRSSNTNLSDNLHMPMFVASADTNFKDKRDAALDGNTNTTISDQEYALSEDHSDAILIDNSNMCSSVVTEMENTVDTRQVVSRSAEALTDHRNTSEPCLDQPSISDATKEMDLQDKSSNTVHTKGSNANLSSNLHMPMSGASSADTSLQEKGDVVIEENGNTNISNHAYPSTSEHQSVAILTDSCNINISANTTISSLHQPSMSGTPEDMDHQDKSSDVVLTEISITNFLNNLHTPICVASTNTNLQENNDAILVENWSTNVSDRECPSIAEDQIDVVDKASSNMEISVEAEMVNVVHTVQVVNKELVAKVAETKEHAD